MKTYYLSVQKLKFVMLIAVILGIIIPCSSLATDQYKGFYIVEPDNFGEWADKWSNWAFQFPSATNPILDTTGEFCDQDQSGRVWFLAGSFFTGVPIVRECRIPARTYVFFPIAQGLSFWPDFPGEGDVCYNSDLPPAEQVRCDVSDDIVPLITGLEVTIDGVRVEDPFAYRAQSSPGGFVFSIPEGSMVNEWGFPAGDRDPAVADGWWLMVGLAPGKHKIHIVVKTGADTAMDVTYKLTVDK
jgi:hypothetical protein